MANESAAGNSSHIDRVALFQQDPYLYATWWVNTVIIVFGMVGNLVALVVHATMQHKIGMNYILMFLSCVDFLLLAAIFLCWTVRDAGWVTFKDRTPMAMYVAMLIFQTMSIWTIVYLSIDRYLAICHPLKAIKLCSVSRAKKGIVALFSSGIVYNLWKVIKYFVLPRKESMSTVYAYKTAEFIFAYVLDPTLLLAVPLLLLLVLNFLLLRAIRKASVERFRLTCTATKVTHTSHNTAAAYSVAALVTLFIVTQTVNIIMFILIMCVGGDYLWKLRLSDTKNIAMTSNSALNIVVYCLFYNKFRSRLLQMAQCQKRDQPLFRDKRGTFSTAVPPEAAV